MERYKQTMLQSITTEHKYNSNKFDILDMKKGDKIMKINHLTEYLKDFKIIILVWGILFFIFGLVLNLHIYSVFMFFAGALIGLLFHHLKNKKCRIYAFFGGVIALLFGIIFGLNGGFTEILPFDIVSAISDIICFDACGWGTLLLTFIIIILLCTLLGILIGCIVGKIVTRLKNE
jgi:predicted branched-subunit amino acid permease